MNNDGDAADRTHRCEFCGKLYTCRHCCIAQTSYGYTMLTGPQCQEEFRCPACVRPAIVEQLTPEERQALEEL